MPMSPSQLDQSSKQMEDKFNGTIEYKPNPLRAKLPQYKIYIFSLFPQDQWVHKGSLNPEARGFHIHACLPNERVSKPLILQSVMSSTYKDHNGAMVTWDDEGEFVAKDIVNPNIGGDWSFGQNLENLGVFWTRNETPTDLEISTARTKLENTYRKCLADATTLETTGKLQFITPLMRLAADYFGEDRPWNKIYKKMGECAICGGPAKENTVMHSCGAVMPGMWPQAIAAGLKTREQAEAAGIDLGNKPKAKQSSQSV